MTAHHCLEGKATDSGMQEKRWRKMNELQVQTSTRTRKPFIMHLNHAEKGHEHKFDIQNQQINQCNRFKREHSEPERVVGVDFRKISDNILMPIIDDTYLYRILKWNSYAFEILEKAIIESAVFLYQEGIRPFVGEMAHQLHRRFPGGTWLPCEVVWLALNSEELVTKVETRVKGEDGWVIYLKSLHLTPHFNGFVDTRSESDIYTPEQWNLFNRYIITNMRASNSSGDFFFTEGRYALAEKLRKDIHAFQSVKLANLIHMVQLACWKKLLSYKAKALVPIAACPIAAKEFVQRHFLSNKTQCETKEQLLKILKQLVDHEPTGVFWAQIKDLVHLNTSMRLDSSSLGHSKLQNLLLSPPFCLHFRLYTPKNSAHSTFVQSIQYDVPLNCSSHKKSTALWNPQTCPMEPYPSLSSECLSENWTNDFISPQKLKGKNGEIADFLMSNEFLNFNLLEKNIMKIISEPEKNAPLKHSETNQMEIPLEVFSKHLSDDDETAYSVSHGSVTPDLSENEENS